jgi:hypothetical protein
MNLVFRPKSIHCFHPVKQSKPMKKWDQSFIYSTFWWESRAYCVTCPNEIRFVGFVSLFGARVVRGFEEDFDVDFRGLKKQAGSCRRVRLKIDLLISLIWLSGLDFAEEVALFANWWAAASLVSLLLFDCILHLSMSSKSEDREGPSGSGIPEEGDLGLTSLSSSNAERKSSEADNGTFSCAGT